MRAILTDRERAVLSGAADATPNYVQTVRSRVRERIRALELDVEVLADAEPSLAAELQDVVLTAVEE
jgi:hypothetical protein